MNTEMDTSTSLWQLMEELKDTLLQANGRLHYPTEGRVKETGRLIQDALTLCGLVRIHRDIRAINGWGV